MDIDKDQAQILNEHFGTTISEGYLKVVVRPFNMGQMLLPQVIADLAELGEFILKSQGLQEKVAEMMKTSSGTSLQALVISELKPVLQPLARCIEICVDGNLAKIPHWFAPHVLVAFFNQNFSPPRLVPWASLLKAVGERQKSRENSSQGSQTTSTSSSNTVATPTGGLTPATNS